MHIAIAVFVAACSHPSCPPAATTVPTPPAIVQTPSKAGAPGEAPSIDLDHGLAMARSYAKQHDVDLSRAYLQGAVFDATARKWVFDWQLPSTKGGLTIIFVSESGDVSVSYGE